MDVEATIRNYLPRVIHMSLATTDGKRPWICEVHFAYDDELNLYFRSLPSRRHSREIAKNPHIAGNIVTQHKLDEKLRGVYFEGKASELTDPKAIDSGFRHLASRLGLGAAVLNEAKRPDGHHIYKVEISDFYVFDSYNAPSGKHHLPWHA